MCQNTQAFQFLSHSCAPYLLNINKVHLQITSTRDFLKTATGEFIYI